MPDKTPSTPDSFGDWCKAIGAPTPSPAGGAAAALAAGLGAALVEMVAGLTRSREKYASAHESAGRILQRAEELRGELLALATRDAEVLAGFARALGLPKGSDSERALREVAKRQALRQAAEVQHDLLRRTAEVAELAAEMSENGLASALGDAATAVFLAGGAARSAYWAIRSDLEGVAGEVEDRESRSLLDSALTWLEQVEATEWRVRQLLSERVR